MIIYTLFIYIIFSIILGIILNKIEREKQNNFFDYVVVSNIYILFLASIFSSKYIYLVSLFQIIGNIIYLTYIKEYFFSKYNLYNIVKYIFTFITVYLLNINFINKVNSVLLSVEQIKFIIWFFIIEYIYFKLKDNINMNKLEISEVKYYQDSEYIVMQYAKFKNKYYNVINCKDKKLNLLVYAIMIYENYNKPKLIRKLDNIKHKLFSKDNKFGIMQVSSNKVIDDITSIKLSIKKIERIYIKNKEIYKIINCYYKRKNEEVCSIYKILKEFDNK